VRAVQRIKGIKGLGRLELARERLILLGDRVESLVHKSEKASSYTFIHYCVTICFLRLWLVLSMVYSGRHNPATVFALGTV
jgi:hypothetical protein